MINTREGRHSGKRGGRICPNQRFPSNLFQPEFSVKLRVTTKMTAIFNEGTSCNAISHNISITLQSLSQSILKEFCISKTYKESQNHWGERNTPRKVDIVFLKTGNLFGLKSEKSHC